MRPSRHVSSTEPNTVSSTEPNTVSSTEPNTVINTHLRKASNILTPYQHKESYDIWVLNFKSNNWNLLTL